MCQHVAPQTILTLSEERPDGMFGAVRLTLCDACRDALTLQLNAAAERVGERRNRDLKHRPYPAAE